MTQQDFLIWLYRCSTIIVYAGAMIGGFLQGQTQEQIMATTLGSVFSMTVFGLQIVNAHNHPKSWDFLLPCAGLLCYGISFISQAWRTSPKFFQQILTFGAAGAVLVAIEYVNTKYSVDLMTQFPQLLSFGSAVCPLLGSIIFHQHWRYTMLDVGMTIASIVSAGSSLQWSDSIFSKVNQGVIVLAYVIYLALALHRLRLNLRLKLDHSIPPEYSPLATNEVLPLPLSEVVVQDPPPEYKPLATNEVLPLPLSEVVQDPPLEYKPLPTNEVLPLPLIEVVVQDPPQRELHPDNTPDTLLLEARPNTLEVLPTEPPHRQSTGPSAPSAPSSNMQPQSKPHRKQQPEPATSAIKLRPDTPQPALYAPNSDALAVRQPQEKLTAPSAIEPHQSTP